MAQIAGGDWPIDPATTDGNTLAEKLNRLVAAYLSGSADNTARPPDAQPGMVWSKQGAGPNDFSLYIFDGTTDQLLFNIASGAVTIPDGYTKAEVDDAIAAAIAALPPPVPTGAIMLWSGASNQIPTGWQLCDGTSGTPNLRNRFVVGAGGAYSVGETGGIATQTEVPRHRHSVSLNTNSAGHHDHEIMEAGNHAHNVRWDMYNYRIDFSKIHSTAAEGSNNGAVTYPACYHGKSTRDTFRALANGAHKHNSLAGGSHTHSVSGNTGYDGVNGGVDNRPPFYALCYIMKV